MKVEPQNGRIASEADAQVVAGMWMISCVDENPGLIYHSVASRLTVDEKKVKKVVENWRELFRPGINPNDPNQERLNALKSELAKMKGLTPEQQKDLKNKLATNDKLEDWCFRSRFRRSLSDPKSELDEIRLGLDYIETQRKTYLEFAEKEREQSVYRVPLLTIMVTLILGLGTLMFNGWMGYKANDLKERELALKASEITSKQQEGVKPSSPAPSSLPAR
jgi:hypothetical protein